MSKAPLMRVLNPFTRVALLAVLLLATVQCGKKSSALTIETIPAEPVVIDSPFKRFPGTDAEVEIEAAWTRFKIKVTNNSTEVITVAVFDLRFNVTGTDGTVIDVAEPFDPSEIEGNTAQTVWMTLQPGDSEVVSYSGAPVDFYIGGLPTGEEVSSFRFRGQLEAIGWVGEEDDAQKTVRVKSNFTTQ